MSEILSFVLSVAAGVVANYIYKWLDEQDRTASTKKKTPFGGSAPKGVFLLVRTVNEILISFVILLYAISRKSQAFFTQHHFTVQKVSKWTLAEPLANAVY